MVECSVAVVVGFAASCLKAVKNNELMHDMIEITKVKLTHDSLHYCYYYYYYYQEYPRRIVSLVTRSKSMKRISRS